MHSRKIRALIQTTSREYLANQIRKISMLAMLRMELVGGPGCLEPEERW